MRFGTEASLGAGYLEWLRITKTGNVGIGTPSPQAKLDVAGAVKMDGLQLGTSSTPGSVLTADAIGGGQWQPALRVLPQSTPPPILRPLSPNIIAGSIWNSVRNGAYGATISGGGVFGTFLFGVPPGTNVVGGNYGTVGGGFGNIAASAYSTVSGGASNLAAGQFSFAAGQRAKANHDGSFVWADSLPEDYASTGANQFSIRAAGGVRLSGGGPLVMDAEELNSAGSLSRGIIFGAGSGEGIVSKRSGDFANSGFGLDFYANSLPRITIRNDGNVGIGTQSPKQKLHVNGDYYGKGHVWLHAYEGDGNSGTAYVQARDDSSSSSIGMVLRTQKNGSIRDAIVLDTDGNTTVNVLTIRGGSDLAEPFQMSAADIPKGSLVVIDDENPGKLMRAKEAYDTRVAGIISGANGINAGITLHQEGVIEGGQNVALSGRVYALADASTGPIKPGDLLTSSDTPGHVMKVSDHTKAQGAIVGKAMSALKDGKGMVLVLVTLQ
jgi:hypothetical protein